MKIKPMFLYFNQKRLSPSCWVNDTQNYLSSCSGPNFISNVRGNTPAPPLVTHQNRG